MTAVRLCRWSRRPLREDDAAVAVGRAQRAGLRLGVVDEADNDPKVLLTYIAEALDAVQPVAGGCSTRWRHRPVRCPARWSRGAAFSAMTTPVVLVLDDVHALRNSECRAALRCWLITCRAARGWRSPGGPSRRAVRAAARRGQDPGDGPKDLSLTCEEASALLRAAQVVLGADEVAELHRRTEGWPVGLYLAALCLREGGSFGAQRAHSTQHRFVSEYVESEFLARIPRRQRDFLTRTAVLEWMCGPLCEAVLDRRVRRVPGGPGPVQAAAGAAGPAGPVVPLPPPVPRHTAGAAARPGARPDPGPAATRRRLVLAEHLPEEALEYSIAAGDVDGAARLVEKLWVPTDRQGRTTTGLRWFRWLDDRGGIQGHPMLAVQAALLAAMTGRPAEAVRWADVVDRWQYQDAARPDDPATEAWAAVLRAGMCRRGVEQMRADADSRRKFAAENLVVPAAPLLRGIARVLSGDLDGGDAALEDAVSAAEDVGAPDVARGRAVRTVAGGDGAQPVGPGRGPGRASTHRVA